MKINLFPIETPIEERIAYLEKFVLFSILAWALYDLLIRYKISNIYWLAVLLGSLLTSISIATTNFGKITTLVFNRYQVFLLNEILSFIERNRRWVGYGIIALIQIIGIYTLYSKFDFTTHQLIGALIFEGIILLATNAKKINDYIKSKK